MEKLKWACDQSFERDRAYGFSWPQRNYKCSFCKKEFKSAQALGGHMNVHRRDRARLRLSSPPESLNQNPNPNSNPSFSLKPKFSAPCNGIASFGVGDPSGAVVGGGSTRGDDGDNERGKKNKVSRVWKENEFVRLDLNLGMFQDVKEDDLDLELRLGYSS